MSVTQQEITRIGPTGRSHVWQGTTTIADNITVEHIAEPSRR